jgi:hypothetical protein
VSSLKTQIKMFVKRRKTYIPRVFLLLTDFVCLYTYEFWLSLCKIVRSSVILLLPLYTIYKSNSWCDHLCVIWGIINTMLCYTCVINTVQKVSKYWNRQNHSTTGKLFEYMFFFFSQTFLSVFWENSPTCNVNQCIKVSKHCLKAKVFIITCVSVIQLQFKWHPVNSILDKH